jgi:endonuclease YncB( thermonuclease family)
MNRWISDAIIAAACVIALSVAGFALADAVHDSNDPTARILPAVVLVESRTVLRYDDEVLEVRRVIDGDTIDIDINPGYHLAVTERCRILGVDTPERGQPGYAEASTFTSSWLTGRDHLRVAWSRYDSFGRILCDLYDPDGTRLSTALYENGHGT